MTPPALASRQIIQHIKQSLRMSDCGWWFKCWVYPINDVATAFPGRREGRDAERMHGDVGVEPDGCDVTLDQLFDRPGRHGLEAETVSAVASYRFLRAEEGSGGIVTDAGHGQPRGQFFDRLQVQRRSTFFVALAGDVEHAVLAIGAEIPHT